MQLAELENMCPEPVVSGWSKPGWFYYVITEPHLFWEMGNPFQGYGSSSLYGIDSHAEELGIPEEWVDDIKDVWRTHGG